MSEKVALSLTRVVNFSDSAASEETGGVEITNTSASICNDTCEDTDDIVNSESAKLAKVVGVIGTIKYFGTFFGKDKYDDEEKGDDDEEISTRYFLLARCLIRAFFHSLIHSFTRQG